MKIGILQCDNVIDGLEDTFGNYPDMLSNPLGALLPNATFEVYRTFEGELPPSVDACDGYITTGSRYGANDGDAWILALEQFVRDCHAAGQPFVGICFGHQVAARALGGQVARTPRGWGVGVSFNQVVARKPWMEPYQEGIDLVVSHQDQVTELPEGGEVLVTSGFCPYYMVRYGDAMITVQGHPEFARGYAREIMARRSDRIPANRIREGLVSLQAPVDDQLMFRWIANFLTANGDPH